MRGLRTLALVIVLALACGLGGLAVAAEEKPGTYMGLPVVAVVIDGQELGTPGLIIDGVTYAPVRALAEALGGGVKWDAAARTVSVDTEPAEEEAAGATTLEGEGTATTTATPEEIAAARVVYDAAVAAAEATRVAAGDALYHQCATDPDTGAFDLDVYNNLYLPALAAADAVRDQALADAAAAYVAATGQQP